MQRHINQRINGRRHSNQRINGRSHINHRINGRKRKIENKRRGCLCLETVCLVGVRVLVNILRWLGSFGVGLDWFGGGLGCFFVVCGGLMCFGGWDGVFQWTAFY